MTSLSSAFEIQLWDARRPQNLAQLARAGVTRDMTRGRAWRRTTQGWFVPAAAPSGPTQRILEAVPVIPIGGALAGWAGAYVLGVDLLDGLDPDTMEPLPLPAHLGRDVGRTAHPGLRVVRERLPAVDRRLWHRLPVTTPLRTAFDGGRWAPDLVEAVVFLDQAAHALELDLSELATWCLSGTRWPGIRQLRAALSLADARSASPWESRLKGVLRVSGPAATAAGQPSRVRPERELPGHPQPVRPRGRAGHRVRWKGPPGASAASVGQPLPGLDRWTLVEAAWWRQRRRAA